MSRPRQSSSSCGSLKQILLEFSQDVNLSGFKYLTKGSKLSRLFWWIVQLTALTISVYLLTYIWNVFATNPTYLSLEVAEHPERNKIPLPSVSVCEINRISKKRAAEYVKLLLLSNKTKRSEENLLEDIKFLGKLYDSDFSPELLSRIVQFQALLEENDPDFPAENFDMGGRLKKLLTPCEEMLFNCFWENQERNCSELFIMEITMDGFCCIFNYVSRRNNTLVSKLIEENNGKPVRARSLEENSQLIFSLVSNSSDYMYSTVSMVGWKILFSKPYDFPDLTSGGLVVRLVPSGVQAYMNIHANVLTAAREIRKYPIEKRHCIFEDEHETAFGRYSYSDCVMECKIKSILALCQCIPFNNIGARTNTNYPQCSLIDLQCINKYADKWNSLYPIGSAGDERLEREKEEGLYCNNCSPTCNDIMYSVLLDYADYSDGEDSPGTGTRTGTSTGDGLEYSQVHVFLENSAVAYIHQDVTYYWFDIVSLFGGLCSLVMGLSFISCLEFAYFCLIKIVTSFFKYS